MARSEQGITLSTDPKGTCCTYRSELTSLPTRARMTVRRGAAGNAIVMFISSICNRSTARRKTYYNTKWMWGHRTLQPHITPHSELCNMKSTVPSPPSLILVKRRNSSPKHSNRGTGGHTPCAVTCRRTLLNNNSQEYIYDTLCWSRQSIQYTLNPLENPYQ